MSEPLVQLDKEADLRLGVWTVQPSACLITWRETRVRVEPKVMQVLVALSRSRGRTVSRRDLFDTCWNDVAVGEDSLERCISRLRKVFGGGPGGVSIETLPKIGYRLDVVERKAPSATSRPSRAAHRAGMGTVTLLSLAVVFLAITAFTARLDRAERSPVSSWPVTALRGLELYPAISPSGGQVVYSWQGESRDNWDLYVQATRGEERLRLTEDPARDSHPAWSPDGGRISFARTDAAGSCAILVVSAVGGPASQVARCGAGGVLSLDWSSNGENLVFASRSSRSAPGRLFLVDLPTRRVRPFPLPERSNANVDDVAFSPDGSQLAYTRVAALGVEDLYVSSLTGDQARRVTLDNLKIHGFDWLPSGRGFVISSNRGGEFALWRVALGGEASLVAGAVGGADEPTLSAGGTLVYEAWRVDTELWRYDLGPDGVDRRRLVSSTRYEWDPALSPDGRHLAYISDRSGAAEIWIGGADGTDSRRLTDFGGPYTHTPRWSPDGSQLAFATPSHGNFDLYRIDVPSGERQRLTSHPGEDFAPAWSPDGEHIYYGSTRSGDWQIWRLSPATGEQRQITTRGGRVAQVAPSGDGVYYVKADRAGLWHLPLEPGAEEERVVSDLEPVDWNNWQVVKGAVYYVRRPRPEEPELARHDFAAQRTRLVLKVPDLLYKSGLWIGADEKTLLLTRVETREADVLSVAPVD